MKISFIIKSVVLLVMIGLILSYTSYLRITKNFYTVEEGAFYRSAQPTHSELVETIEKYHIKSVLSLRGNPPGFFGEEPESETLKKQNVEFFPIPLSLSRYPDKEQILKIIEILDQAPKPILVHCRSGADRTGLISALYVLHKLKQSKEQALEQLSMKYWHFEYSRPQMRAFISAFNGVEWLKNNYNPCLLKQFSNVENDCRVSSADTVALIE